MLRMKNFKFQLNRNPQKSTLTGAMTWKGSLRDRLLDLYIVALKVLNAAEWNSLDQTLFERLKRACGIEAAQFYNVKHQMFFQQAGFYELLDKGEVSAEEFVKCVEENAARTSRTDVENMYLEYTNVNDFTDYSVALEIKGAFDMIDDTLATDCIAKISEWDEKKITDEEFIAAIKENAAMFAEKVGIKNGDGN